MAAIKKKILNLKTPKTRAIAAKKDPTCRDGQLGLILLYCEFNSRKSSEIRPETCRRSSNCS
jgi:hypothetical protein